MFSLFDKNVNFLLSSLINVVAVCAEETVPLTALSTLILEERLSTFKTFTFSEFKDNISFSLIERSPRSIIPPLIEKYVIIPVAPAVPTPVVKLWKSVVTPMLKDPLFKLMEVLNPDRVTKSVFFKL